MRLFVILGLIIIFFNKKIIAITHENMAQSLVQFLTSEANIKPTKLNLFLDCWQTEEIKTFIKTLSKHKISAGKTNFQTDFSQKAEIEMFVADFSCKSDSDKFSTENSLLQFPYRWFIFIDSINLFPKALPIYLNSRIYLFEKQFPHALTSPYKVVNSNFYVYNKIATWLTLNNSYSSPLKDLSDYQDRVNQNGLTINSTGVMIFPRTAKHMQDWRFLSEDPITKHNFLLLHHLMDIMNSSMNLTFASAWGTKAVNGTRYNGMMGDLQSGVAEIAGTIGFITKDRIAFADYVSSPIPTTGQFIFKAPPLSVVNNILTMPLGTDVWVSMLVLTLIIFGLMLITTRWEWRAFDFTESVEAYILRPTPLEVLQLEIGAICQQGTEAEPRSLSGRIITFCTFLAFLFLYTAYSACIVALLQSTSNSITSLDHLLNTNIKLGVDNAPYSKFFFSIQKGKTKEAIYKQKIVPPNKPENFIPPEIGVERIRTEFFAFHAERDSIFKAISKTYLEHEKCGLVEIKFLSEIEPYMLIKKKSPYKEIVTMAYSKFKEFGLSNRIYKLTYADKPKCRGSGGSFRSVSLADAYFALMCYFIGIGITMVIYFIEICIKTRENNVKIG